MRVEKSGVPKFSVAFSVENYRDHVYLHESSYIYISANIYNRVRLILITIGSAPWHIQRHQLTHVVDRCLLAAHRRGYCDSHGRFKIFKLLAPE